MLTTKRATAILKQLGAGDAAALGREHRLYPHVHRHVLLTEMWKNVLDDNADWASTGPSDDPVEQSIAAVLAAGVAPEDLTRIVRQFQIDLLFNVCQFLEGSGELLGDLAAEVDWRLYEYERGKSGRPIDDLHASFHQHDPSGRDGEPRPRHKPRPVRKQRAKR